MSERKDPSINKQSQLVLATISVVSGAIVASEVRQQGVNVASGVAGWAFTTDGTNGSLTVTLDSDSALTPGGVGSKVAVGQALAASGAPLQVVVTSASGSTLIAVVYEADGSAPVDLTADDATVQIIAGQT